MRHLDEWLDLHRDLEVSLDHLSVVPPHRTLIHHDHLEDLTIVLNLQNHALKYVTFNCALYKI